MNLNAESLNTLKAENEQYLKNLTEARGKNYAETVRFIMMSQAIMQLTGSITLGLAEKAAKASVLSDKPDLNILFGPMALKEALVEYISTAVSTFSDAYGFDDDTTKEIIALAETRHTELVADVAKLAA